MRLTVDPEADVAEFAVTVWIDLLDFNLFGWRPTRLLHPPPVPLPSPIWYSLVRQNIAKAGAEAEPSVGTRVRIPPQGHLLTTGFSAQKIKYTTLHPSPTVRTAGNQGQTKIRNLQSEPNTWSDMYFARPAEVNVLADDVGMD
jgi:hypothetical protein